MQAELWIFEVSGMAQRLTLDAVLADPYEVKVVGKNDVLRESLVARDLIGFQDLVEMFADCLVLDVTENEAAAGDLEIRGALVCHALWFVLNRCSGATLTCELSAKGSATPRDRCVPFFRRASSCVAQGDSDRRRFYRASAQPHPRFDNWQLNSLLESCSPDNHFQLQQAVYRTID